MARPRVGIAHALAHGHPESQRKPRTRRTGAKKAAAAEQETERQALASKPANQGKKAARGRNAKPAEETEEEEEEEGADVLATPPGSDEPARAKAGRGRPRKEAVVPESIQKAEKPVASKRGRRKAAEPEALVPQQDGPSEIPETQADDPMDTDAEEQDQVEDLPSSSRFGAVRASASKRPASPSSHEDDPSVRRRLGDVTKRYEALERKYKDLRDVAVTEAEKTFDLFKKTSEEKAQTAHQLIAVLRSDVASQRQLAKEGQKSRHQLEASEAKVDNLQAQVTEMTTSLADAQTEIKALTTKLNAARAAEAAATAQVQVATARVPGSAMKPGIMGARGLDAAQVQATQTAKMKENLYSDLTGLVVTGVKRDGLEDVYDCIQTGRNGTLHFKLAIANENSDENLDEAEFLYKPQLDERRDSKLIEVLPDFLVEEITFSRPQAAKFYARVLKSLTEKIE